MRVLRVSHSAVVDAWRERERALRARGHVVHLLSAACWNEGGADIPLEGRRGEDVVGVRTWGSHPALFLYDPRPLWRALGGAWDVIDVHEEPFALSTFEVLALRALRRQQAPYVLYSAQNIDKRYPIPFRWLERWALRGAAGVSVCNVAAGRVVQRKGLAGPASVIPLGTDLDHFTPGGAPRTRPSEVVEVAYVGRLEPHKGVAILLDAVSGEPTLRLRLAGAGSLEAAIRSRIERDKLEDRVQLVGTLSDDELPDFYRSADVVAIPSLTTPSWLEQFGRVAVEAMACGTPVVASDSGALPDVLGGAGVLVPPGDAVSLRQALLRVGRDAELASELARAGRDRAVETSWETVAERYESLYAAAQPPRTRVVGESPLPPVEVVVVAYGSSEQLARTLEPLTDEPVIVVDNSSSADVRRVCEQCGVRYVDPGRNGGFAAGVNEGLRHRRFENSDVLLLNPDAEAEPSGIRELQKALRARPDLASVSPLLVDHAGRPERVRWPFPTPVGAWLDALGLGRLRRDSDGFVVGAVMLLRAEALQELGGFDERFFLYAEETDWARRAVRRGWRHEVVPSAVATHVGAGTSSDPARREAHFFAGQERYFRKHYGAAGWQVARSAQVAGAMARSALPGARGAAARGRLGILLRGPRRVERAHLPEAWERAS